MVRKGKHRGFPSSLSSRIVSLCLVIMIAFLPKTSGKKTSAIDKSHSADNSADTSVRFFQEHLVSVYDEELIKEGPLSTGDTPFDDTAHYFGVEKIELHQYKDDEITAMRLTYREDGQGPLNGRYSEDSTKKSFALSSDEEIVSLTVKIDAKHEDVKWINFITTAGRSFSMGQQAKSVKKGGERWMEETYTPPSGGGWILGGIHGFLKEHKGNSKSVSSLGVYWVKKSKVRAVAGGNILFDVGSQFLTDASITQLVPEITTIDDAVAWIELDLIENPRNPVIMWQINPPPGQSFLILHRQWFLEQESVIPRSAQAYAEETVAMVREKAAGGGATRRAAVQTTDNSSPTTVFYMVGTACAGGGSDNAACNVGSECCSGLCNDGTCVHCLPELMTQCASDLDCCEGLYCTDQRCIQVPSSSPSAAPSLGPSSTPSAVPSAQPSSRPSAQPSSRPSSQPSSLPSNNPSTAPSDVPSSQPSASPSSIPSDVPSTMPSSQPSSLPSNIPSSMPSMEPSVSPSSSPTLAPRFDYESCEEDSHCIGGACTADSVCGSPLEVYLPKGLGSPTELPVATAEAYGTNQDGGGGIIVSQTGLEMYGNSWRSFALTYQVTKKTVLEFDFALTAEAEGHAICLDEDNNEDVELPLNRRCFFLAGSQSSRWKEVWKLEVTGEGQEIRYTIQIGAPTVDQDGDQIPAYINPGTIIHYLAFIQDNDSDSEIGRSIFSNIRIYEDNGDRPPSRISQVLCEKRDSIANLYQNFFFASYSQSRSMLRWNDYAQPAFLGACPYDNLQPNTWSPPQTIVIEECYPGLFDACFKREVVSESISLNYLPMKKSCSYSDEETDFYDFSTSSPTSTPTQSPTSSPSNVPSGVPSLSPPSNVPSGVPSLSPSTVSPSSLPSQVPSAVPSQSPTSTDAPQTVRRSLSQDTNFMFELTRGGFTGQQSVANELCLGKSPLKASILGAEVPADVDSIIFMVPCDGSDPVADAIERIRSQMSIVLDDCNNVPGVTCTASCRWCDYIEFHRAPSTPADDLWVPHNSICPCGEEPDPADGVCKMKDPCFYYPSTCPEHSQCDSSGSYCECNSGFRSNDDTPVKIVYSDLDSICVRNEESDQDVTGESFLMTVHNELEEAEEATKATKYRIMCTRLGEADRPPLSVAPHDGMVVDVADKDADLFQYNFTGLLPGKKYRATLVPLSDDDEEQKSKYDLSTSAVTHCCCDCPKDNKKDVSGRPDGFQVKQQRGQITFAFTDNSRCAEAYAFTRTDLVEEFSGIDDESKKTVFTSNYYYYPKKVCGRAPITPGLGASDDLRISQLLVGTGYRYCVRAVAQFYSDHLYDEGETLYSSDETCQVHYIKWQASIAGKITTAPESGSIPIETVLVTWELLDLDKVNVISSGRYTTKKDGGFAITFDETSGLLENDIDYPVRIKFFKVSAAIPEDISHSFLCNQGTVDCTDAGTIVYLRHLQFEAPVHTYDDTSVPFTGRIIIGDTASDESGEGCAIYGAQVCLFDKHARTGDTQGVCVRTGPTGDFLAPAVIGSTVSVQVNYQNHTFLPTFENDWDYDDGIFVDINRRYERHDFMDMTKANLFVEVAGGLCDHTLGTSKIRVKVANCKWSQTITQDAFKAAHTVPGHVLNVRVVDVIDPSTERTRNKIQEWFLPDDMEQSVNLLETAAEDDEIGGGDDSLEASEMEQEEEALQETRETVRFQFDGDLEISFVVVGPDEKGDCEESSKKPEVDETYSLHVMPTGSAFIPGVFLKYKLLDTDPPLYCDILRGDMQVTMRNRVGVDGNGFDEYSTKTTDSEFESLVLCSDRTFANRIDGKEDVDHPACLVNVTHDSEGRNAHAIPLSNFKTGRPNPYPDYKKRFTVAVKDRGLTRTHVAEFIVTGDFDRGPGASFGLPTYKPILVLRDPPGGLSTASYTNVQTTIAVTMENTKVMAGFNVGLNAAITGGQSLEVCSGGGFGVMLLACLAVQESAFKLDATLDGGADFMSTDTTDTYTGKYTTTWSYTTSDDPLLAGRSSDTMVVPNLNVEYHEVVDVQWTSASDDVSSNCKVTATTEVKFDIKSKENLPTLSFLSVHNIETYRIKGLEEAIQELQDESEKPGKTNAELEDISVKKTTLTDALKGWNDAISDYEITNDEAREKTLKIAPADWFGQYAAIQDHGVNEPIPKAVWSSLAPERLVKRAEALPYDYVNRAGLGDKEALKVTNRIQFSGGGSTMTFSMDHEQIEEAMQLDPDAAPIDNSLGRAEVGIESDNSFLALLGVDIEAHGETHVDTSHSKMRTDTGESQTVISFTLGDGDREDEFVTDVYIDPKHGTFVFPLISGRSKSPHEVNTKWGEEPSIEIWGGYPTRPVLADDEIVIQLKIANKGLSASGFSAELDHRHNQKGLQFHLSGESLSGPIGFWLDPGGIFEVFQELTIKRGPVDFLYEPAIMQLTSEWDGYGDEGVETEIFNHIHEGKKWIKFEQPCPKVEWAGTIGRERSFLINSLQSSLKMTIFNPSHALGSFEELSNETRLDTVDIRYRLIGAVDWSIAYDLAAPAKEEADAETSYGYLNRIWDMDNPLIEDGTYELKVETVCKTVTGAPDDFNTFRTQSIIGVIDRIEPKLYGSPLPLRDLVIPGEEVILIFTEPILCAKPYRFELDVVVAGIDGRFDERNLNIICEERKLAFQFDQSVRYDELMGRQMNVTVKGVSDRNHNTMKENAPPIMFSKKIANLNLDEVSTSFTFTLNTASCSSPVDDTEAIRSQIATILTVYDSNRINIINAVCKGTATEATVTIGPSASPGVRRKLSENIPHSLDLFYALQQVSKNETHRTRMLADDDGTKPLSFAVRNLRVVPGTSDAALFKTTVDQVRKEEMIRQGKGDADSFIQEERMIRVGEKLEEQMKLWSAQSASVVQSDDTHTLDVVLEELRLEREQMRKVLSEKSASAAGTDYDHILDAVLEEVRLERQEMRKTLHRMLFIAIGVGAVSSLLLYSRKC
jgi:hypothetical protein